ncbi:hypothetical protein GCM10022380_84880 [Amycolatopsis tucumanensis]|uniref:Aldehyde dehydrogenase domain-containing protein n=1 Tax=Amycolatopsis tucumanensis TaxID=401106 RepID=A0ABP7JT75_9PSEU
MILDDADLERAVECAVFGSYYHQGQICMATNRVIVDASVHDEFVDRFVEQAHALRVGDPRNPATQIGGTGSWRGRGALVERHGEIVVEFFDVGQSRSIPWKRRPEAARLLEVLKRRDRGFEAVVVGEPQRAFYGNQYGLTFPVFAHYGVGLWVPEVGGADQDQGPGAVGDGGAGPGGGPLPGWPPSLRLSAG